MDGTTSLFSRPFRWAAMLALCCSQVMASPVHVLFGREILGIPWTASKADIELAVPGGKWSVHGAPQTYTVADGSTIFRVPRTTRQTIAVAMNDAGKIASVSVTFPNGSETHLDLLENLSGFLGEPSAADTTVTRDSAGKANVRTVWEDNELRVTLVHTILTTTFTTNQVIVMRISANP